MQTSIPLRQCYHICPLIHFASNRSFPGNTGNHRISRECPLARSAIAIFKPLFLLTVSAPVSPTDTYHGPCIGRVGPIMVLLIANPFMLVPQRIRKCLFAPKGSLEGRKLTRWERCVQQVHLIATRTETRF